MQTEPGSHCPLRVAERARRTTQEGAVVTVVRSCDPSRSSCCPLRGWHERVVRPWRSCWGRWCHPRGGSSRHVIADAVATEALVTTIAGAAERVEHDGGPGRLGARARLAREARRVETGPPVARVRRMLDCETPRTSTFPRRRRVCLDARKRGMGSRRRTSAAHSLAAPGRRSHAATTFDDASRPSVGERW